MHFPVLAVDRGGVDMGDRRESVRDATVRLGSVGPLEVVGGCLEAASNDDKRCCKRDDGSTDDVRGRVSLPFGVDAKSCLTSNAADTRDHRVERHDGGSLFRRSDRVDERLTHRHLDTHRDGADEEEDESDGEVRSPANADGCEREPRGGPEEKSRSPTTVASKDLDEAVARDHRQGQQCCHHTGNPDGVALEEFEEVRLPCVPGPHEEAGLCDHDQPQRTASPPVADSRYSQCIRLCRERRPRDLSGLEADVVHSKEGEYEEYEEESRADDEGECEVDLAEQSATDRPDEHGDPTDDLSIGEDAIHLSVVAEALNPVDEPGLHGSAVEREAESDEYRRDRERDHACSCLCKPHVARTTSDKRNDARRPIVSATTPVGISNRTVPTENAAFAMKTSAIESPASRRKSVLIPQMIDAASV